MWQSGLWRSWRALKSPQIQLAIAALSIGIGATTAIYTVVHAVLLEPLPWTGANRFFLVFTAYRNRPNSLSSFAHNNAMETQARMRSTDAFGYYAVGLFGGSYNAIFNGQAVHLAGTQVQPVVLRSLGVAPAMGRWLDDDLDSAVISASLWRRFGSDPQILGRSLTMNGAAYSIVGVAPASFRFPIEASRNDVWVPLVPDTGPGHSTYLACLAKLKTGVPKHQLEDELNGIQAQWAREHSAGEGYPELIKVLPVLTLVVDAIRPTLLLLLGAAAALLIIACANVASLLLARAVVRARETAVRVALGATSSQLGAQYFAEGLVVALPGAILGILASIWAVRQVLTLAADDIPRAERVSLNIPVLLFTLAVAILCALLVSLAPLWQARRTEPREVLGDGTRSSSSARSRSVLRVFVVAELVLAFGLVAIGGMLFEQLRNLRRVQPGFDTSHLLTFAMAVPSEKYPNEDAVVGYDSRLIAAVQAIPGVQSAGFGWKMPLAGYNGTALWFDGQPEPDIGKALPVVQDFVSPDYFRAMGIPLLEGRFFTDEDRVQGKILPLIINQTAARTFWGERGPLGSLVHLFSWESDKSVRFQIVGVVGDVRNVTLGEPVRAEVYFTFREVSLDQMAWAVRSPLGEETLLRQIREAVSQVDKEQAIFDVRQMADVVAASVTRERLASFMTAVFAISALILAILGVYGVVAYSVRQRTTEMGTRMALGATSGDLLRLVIGDGLQMSAIGIGIGFVSVFALARYLGSSDLHLKFASPWPFLAATVLTGGFTGLACFVPAWRTTLLSPLVAIRNDGESILMRYIQSARKRSRPAETRGDHDLLADLVDSGRRAESFEGAFQAALATLREDVGAEFAALLAHSAPEQPYRTVAVEPDSKGRTWTLPASVLLRRITHYSLALPITSDDLESALRWAAEVVPAHSAEIRTLQEMRAGLAAPVVSKTDQLGLLLLGRRIDGAEYTAGEMRAVYRAGAHFALLVTNGRLAERVVEQEKLRRELQVASEVQRRLFPDKLPETAVVNCAGMCLPARGVGGDYYDFIDLGNRHMGIALADVAGKGIAAALVMSVVQASLRSLAESTGASLAGLASKMNRLLYRSTGPNSYATFFYAQFDEERRQLRYVNAGHNPPYLLRASTGELEELSVGGTIIGMFPVARYEEAIVEFQPGDVLMAFTDGVSEAHDPAEDEFGEDF
jgi:putative ABC transport system permease protein